MFDTIEWTPRLTRWNRLLRWLGLPYRQPAAIPFRYDPNCPPGRIYFLTHPVVTWKVEGWM